VAGVASGFSSRSRLRRRTAALGVVAIAALGLPSMAAAATATARLDRPQVAVGEAAVLSIEVEGSQDASAPELGDVAGIVARYVGPATEMRFENGRMSSSITHRYQLIGRQAGRFTLGPFAVTVDGETLRTEPVVLQVLPAGQGGAAAGRGEAAPALSIEARLGRDDPFVGERVPLSIRVLIPGDARVDDLQFPTVQADAVTVGEMPQPTQREERIGGRPYRVLYIDTHLTPLAAGGRDLTVSMAMNVLEPRRGNRGVFGMFGNMLAERRPVELRSEPIRFSPRDLPAGRPSGFAGAVGTFDLEISAAPLVVHAGDPVTVRIAVTGDNLTQVRPPRFAQIDGFRVYDPVPVKDGGAGRRMIEQVVIPQSPGADELPALSFSFFDPQGGAYRTVHRGPIALNVEAASNLSSGVVAEGESGRLERAQGPLGRDIVYIKNAPGDWVRVRSSWVGSPGFWIFNALPALACAFLWWRQRRENLLAANPALQRFRTAESKAREALSALSVRPAESGFFDELSRTLGEFLAAKLGLPPGAGEAARISRAMRAAGYEDELCRETASLITSLEDLRYAPSRSGEVDRHALLGRAERLVAAVERRKDVTDKLARALVVGIAVVTVFAAPLRAADPSVADAVEASFFAGNHAYADGRYGDAVASYEQALAAGEASGALYFNLGNALFKRGDVPAALASYLRAQRLLPRDPDVAANLSFARESLELAGDDPPYWQRAFFAIAYRTTEAELALAAAALWWLLCGAGAVALAAPRLREPLRWPLCIGAALLVVVAANLVYRHQALELRGEAVVTAANGAAVRFEPRDDGTEHFEAPPGTRLTVSEQRDGWAQVSRRDGRRGWVKSNAITGLR
jgi:tetratricopeptide (TPR) repeat protein